MVLHLDTQYSKLYRLTRMPEGYIFVGPRFAQHDLSLTTHWGGKCIYSSTTNSAFLLPTSLHAPNDLVSMCWVFFQLKRLFKLLWKQHECSLITTIEVIMLFCHMLPGRCYQRHSDWKTNQHYRGRGASIMEKACFKHAPLKLQEDGRDLWASPCSVCSSAPSLAGIWKELHKLRPAALLLLLTGWSNSLGFKWDWGCWIFIFSCLCSRLGSQWIAQRFTSSSQAHTTKLQDAVSFSVSMGTQVFADQQHS